MPGMRSSRASFHTLLYLFHGLCRTGAGCGGSFPSFLLSSFFSSFPGAPYIFLGQAEGKGGLATSRLRADCRLETDSVYITMMSIGGMRLMIKQNKNKKGLG